jgi:hypothetical protein
MEGYPMSEMTTLGKVFDRVQSMSLNHEDKYIKVKDISFDGLDLVKIGGDMHRMRPVAQQSIANRLGIPIQYLRRCNPEMQSYNMNHWIREEKNEELFFRFDRDEVRAVFTPRYIPTDNIEVMERLYSLDYSPDDRVQCSLDDEFMMMNIPDGQKTYSINGDKMTPGVSISNSEVGLASLSISAFILRLKCTNGMISKTEVTASYRHISAKILDDFPKVLDNISVDLGRQKNQFRLSLESKVDNPEMTINSFNRQFQLNKEEKDAVDWSLPLECGDTMFHVINIYTKASQYEKLTSENRYRLQKVGGAILGMVK